MLQNQRYINSTAFLLYGMLMSRLFQTSRMRPFFIGLIFKHRFSNIFFNAILSLYYNSLMISTNRSSVYAPSMPKSRFLNTMK